MDTERFPSVGVAPSIETDFLAIGSDQVLQSPLFLGSRILCCLSVLGFSAVSRFVGFSAGSKFSDSLPCLGPRILGCLSVLGILCCPSRVLRFSGVSRFLGILLALVRALGKKTRARSLDTPLWLRTRP